MEESRSGASRKSWPKDEFTDLVLSWSLQEIVDEDLYKYQVEKIPDSFECVDEYLGSYVFPLLEETRAELASAIETAHKAPFAEVTYFGESKIGTLLYDVQVDHWRNRIRDRDGVPYRTLPGDVVLLSDLKPETASVIQNVGWTFTFASVRAIEDGKDDDNGITSSYFKVKTTEHIEVESTQSKPLFVVYLMNITPHERVWKALGMRRNMKIIEKVLWKNDLGEDTCEFCPDKCHGEMEGKYGPTLLSNLNESQKEAILSTLVKIECNERSSIELIWGPPGTGKTATTSILLYMLLRVGVKTLVCAPTNVAITELASRVVALLRKSVEAESEQCFGVCPLGDMLIFGNKDRLKVGSDIEEIYLDHRVERLENCLLKATGWRHSIVSMLDFLENCVSEHQIYVENEQVNAKESPEHDMQHSNSKTLLEFARDRFVHLAKPLRKCMLALFTHLPRSFIPELNFQSMQRLITLLDKMKGLLFEDSGLISEQLESIFIKSKTIGSESLVDTSSLLYVKCQCLSSLRSLQASLNKILSDTTLIPEFCFKKASLIFCTTSSSYKLHSVDVDPFTLLVIDEAAQVKECESVIALQIPDVRYAILVGDEQQLTATVSSKLSEKAGYGKSLFERLSLLGHSKHLLNMQYRMHPSISQFPNSNFYHNQIQDALCVQSKSYDRCYLEGKLFGSYSFINIRDGKEENDDVGHSIRNLVEVAVMVELVRKLFKAWDSTNPKEKLSIGLISPYAAQVVAIRDKLQEKYAHIDKFIIKVKSIDGFQGGEEDIVIISTVRSNKGRSIGFLSSPRRTNVALTRARHCLWILGNEGTLRRTDSVWKTIIDDAKRRNCFFNADEDCDIQKTIIDVKKELEQLEDLLSEGSILFQNSRWKVLFSDNFRKSFQKLKPFNVKKLAVNSLLKLASGWRPKKVNLDWKCESSSHIVKQFKVEKYYVVCTIDIIKDSTYVQVLKVWDILPIAETQKLLKRLDSIFSTYTDDFISHCKEKFLEGTLEVPKSWPTSKDIIRFKDLNNNKCTTGGSTSTIDCRSYVENSKVSESLLLMKFYSLSSGAINHLLSDLDGREVDLPFEVTDEEREIIKFHRSSFILGRSGTGKTTILTMKLFQKLQLYCMASRDTLAADNSEHFSDKVSFSEHSDEPRETMLHQLFVTVSPKLCHAVKKHVSQLKSFESGNFIGKSYFTDIDDVDEMAEFKDIPDTFVGIQQEKYPLIITFHKFLMMLDGTLGGSYFERFRDARSSFQNEGRRSVALQTFIRKNEVTFDRFRGSYWPHFNENLKKSLDPSRVFTEIMSHIKGGVQEGDACDTKRSREAYISLSDSRASALTAKERDLIYNIFEDYEKRKLERGEFDLADFVIDVHHRLKEGNLLGDKMDFVYIDEVQDLTMKQLCLFRDICKNVDEGFVFAGDTAQTIARGIDFRFEDIRSLFYNEFFMKSRNCQFPGRREKGLISDIFSLSQNFRTHTGVLRLAQSVIDLISYFFPQSIDSLTPETSLIYGEPPIVLEPGSDENSIISIFGHSESAGEKWVGFGADQVILVRDDSAREEISNYIGHQALILTVVECKGLEFQDVLLYNFFGSSPMSSNQWRVVYEFLKEKDLLDADSPKSFTSFSRSKHNILCSELKQLYVAITRTRQRLWICENSEELCKPMLDYWRRLCLVQVRKIDQSLAKAMQRASNPDEWKSQGIKLFWEKNYEMASMCFERAGEETWEKKANASGLRAAADHLQGSNSKEARVMLREAAEMFDSIGSADSAAECFCDLEEYERAGRIYEEKSDLRKAGECFCLAGSHEIAAKVYAQGNFFKECLSACIEGDLFDLGLQYIESWKQQAPWNGGVMARFKEINKIAQEFLEKCASDCHAKKDNELLMKFVRAFNTMESKRNFLKSLDCLEELLVLEEESGNFDEAAGIAKRLGDVLREVDLLEKAQRFADASSLLLSYVVSHALWMSGNQRWPQKDEILERVVSLARKHSEMLHASVCAEAKILSDKQIKLSELMQCYVDSKQGDTRMGEVLSIRKLVDAHFQIHPASYEWERELHLDPRLLNERILRNQVSSATLVYVWNLWKVQSLEMLECLDSLDSLNLVKCEGAARFCLSYFGVRLHHDLSVKCVLLNPNATWVKRNVDERFVVWNRKVATLDARHFSSAARKHWIQELLSVGLRVLEALRSLYRHSTASARPLSKYCQSVCLTSIFGIAKFFTESKSLDVKKADDKKLHDFLQLSTLYFGNVFPLDSRQSLSESIILLRQTAASKNLLEEIICMNIDGGGQLSYGQIGRVVMIMLGSGKPKRDLCDRIAERFDETPRWQSFVKNLMGIMEPNSPGESKLGKGGVVSEPPLSQEFYWALKETYNTNWRAKDYISPNCFFYLVERLLILVPHSQGCFFTTKSSFLEYLLSQEPDAHPSAALVAEKNSSARSIIDFVFHLVRQCLNDTTTTVEWIRVSRLDCKYYLPVLVLRLFVILCLLCLDSEFTFSVVFQQLRLPQVRSYLPREFCEALGWRKKNDQSYLSAVAGAFKVVGDPLMIVSISEQSPRFLCPDAISLDLRSYACRNEVMEALFPSSLEGNKTKSGSTNDLEPIPYRDRATEHKKAEDLAVAADNSSNEAAESSQGKEKNKKKNNKSKKGRGGRKK